MQKEDFSVFASCHIIRRIKNYGFEANAEDLLHQVWEIYDRFIILEDDLELSPNYLEYINKCLSAYEGDKDIVAVCGYSYPVDWIKSQGATAIKQNYNAAAWGRAFWKSKRALYKDYISSGQLLRDVDKMNFNKLHEKMIDAALCEYIPAAMCPLKRLNKLMYFPCDISMRAYLAVADKYVISPVISKVRNYGFDGSGVYCQSIDIEKAGNNARTYNYGKQPIDENPSFDLVLDTNECITENRDRLNSFDVRTCGEMRRTRVYLWLLSHYNISTGKVIAAILLPWDVLKRLWAKIMHVR